MKPTPALLLLLLACGAVHAEPIYRCVDDTGQIAFQDSACTTQPAAPVAEAAPVEIAYAHEAGYTQGGWTNQQRWQRRREAKLEWRAEAQRVGQLLQPSTERKAAAYASSNQRCRLTLQIAALCGTTARPFSCDAKGFHGEPAAEPVLSSVSTAADRASAFQRQQCALQMTRGR